MTTRDWPGPTGVGSGHEWIEIKDEDWSEMARDVAIIIGTNPPKELRGELNGALNIWRAANDLHRTNIPSHVKVNLQSALSAALELNNAINMVDGNGRQLIDEYQGYSVGKLYKDIERIIAGLNFALSEANRYPEKGRTVVNHAPREFAKALFVAIRSHIGAEYARKGRPKLFNYLYRTLVQREIHRHQKNLNMGPIGLDEKAVAHQWRQALDGYYSRTAVDNIFPKQG